MLQDLVCPDLERVVADIRADANRTRRRRRAAALLATLQRSWDRAYAERAQVQVVSAYHQWNFFGVTVTAWWLARLRDEPWLPDADGRLCAPRDLVLPSAANRAVYGDAGHYADGALVLDLRDDLVRALGITGDPRVSDVLTTLQQVRDAHPNVASADDRDDWETAAAATYPMYGILADWLSATKRRRMDVPADHVRQAFQPAAALSSPTTAGAGRTTSCPARRFSAPCGRSRPTSANCSRCGASYASAVQASPTARTCCAT